MLKRIHREIPISARAVIQSNERRRLLEADVLRASAIFMIVLVHMRDYLVNQFPSDLAGYLTLFGVGLFAFISGYVLQESSPEIGNQGEAKTFLWRRFIRIYPLYWISLGLFVLILPWHPDSSISSLPIFFSGMQEILAPQYVQPTSYLWFIGLIGILSLVYPLLVWRERNSWKILLTSITVFSLLVILRLLFGIIEYRVFLFFFLFVAGILFRQSNPSLIGGIQSTTGTFILIAAIIMPCCVLWIGAQGILLGDVTEIVTLFIKSSMALAFCIASLFVAQMVSKHMIGKTRGLFQFCSHASYCVFLFHVLIFYWLNELLTKEQTGGTLHDMVIIGAVPIIFLIANFIQNLESYSQSKIASFSIWTRQRRTRSSIKDEKETV